MQDPPSPPSRTTWQHRAGAASIHPYLLSSISDLRFRVNHQIRSREVRLIDENDQQIGVVTTQDALRRAVESGLDLVEVSPNAQPPVCRILDIGKFLYQQEKQQRQARAKQKKIEVKGIRLSLTIGDHDTAIRLERARGFLAEGHKVKVELILRGRQNQRQDLAREIMEKFAADLGDGVKIEQSITRAGNRLNLILAHR